MEAGFVRCILWGRAGEYSNINCGLREGRGGGNHR